MNSSNLQCTHSHQPEYRQLYDLDEQSGSVKVDAQKDHLEPHSTKTITVTNINMSAPLSHSKRIELLNAIGSSNCLECALDLTQKAVDWLNSGKSTFTEKAILYLVTAYKIQKKCKGDLTEIEEKIWGAFSSCQCREGNNLLHHFIERESLSVIRYLLECQFQGELKSWLEKKNAKGSLPIHTAIMTGNSEVVNLLLQVCPSHALNTQDKDGNTPLHLAVQQAVKSKGDLQKFKPVIIKLLETNADPEIMNSQSERPLDLARDSKKAKDIFFNSNQFCLRHVKNEMICFYTSNNREIKRSFQVDVPPFKIEECFINLSIVKEEEQKNQERETFRNKRSREQIFGSYEDVFKTGNKEHILPKDLFEPREVKSPTREVKNPKRLLILGRAGIGKSTLCQYLTHQWWGNDGVWKNQFDLVVKINLRNLTKERYPDITVSLEKIIVRECFQSTNQEKKEIQHIEKALASISQKRKLFLLDGYDEFPTDSPCKTAINTLLGPQNDSYLIVTSRPYANMKSADFDFCLECIGFTSEDIPKYLNLPGVCEDIDAAKRIFAFLKRNPPIHNLAHIPILLDAFTLSNETILASESVTITKLYEHIVNKIWEKYNSTQAELNPNQKDADDKQEQAERFLKALAFHVFLEHGIVFSYNSVEKVAMGACGWKKHQVAGRVESLMTPGFLNCYRYKNLAENQYSFPHLTIQEYLAALYITDWLSADSEIQVYSEITGTREQITAKQFILKNRYNPRFQIVWNFVSGILADSNQEYIQPFFDCLLQEPKDIIGSYHTCLLIRCLEEAGLPDLGHEDLFTQLKESCEMLIKKKSIPLLDTLKLSSKMVIKLGIIEKIISALKTWFLVVRSVNKLPDPQDESLGMSDYETILNYFFFFQELVKAGHHFPDESIHIFIECLSTLDWEIVSNAGEALGAILKARSNLFNQIFPVHPENRCLI
ncbi:MAG: NACHT domain-containing protein [Parachlamydiaceae bacterium]